MVRRLSFTLLLMVACLNQASLADEPAEVRLAATLHEFQSRYDFPGATAAIVLPDGTLLEAATGLADPENGRLMSPDTPMLAASIGKTLVATTVLQLESDQRLARDDLLATHLGDRPWFASIPNAEAITLDQLLRHTSGLPDHVHLPAFQKDLHKIIKNEGPFEPEALIEYVAGREPLFAAGEAWAYSDTGYVLLGLVIEDVTGNDWHQVVQNYLLGPLGLASTFPSNQSDLPGLAVGYTDPGNPFGLSARTADAEGRILWNPAVESAGGGFASTSGDLARWGHLLFGGSALQQPYLDRLLEGVAVDPDSSTILYGTGVAIYTDTPRGPSYGHGGWIPGFVSSLRHYADYSVTVAFQVNTDVGIADDTSDFVPALEAALADFAISLSEPP